MKYEAIRAYSSDHSVRKMCKVLGLKESGYYQWKSRFEKNLRKREEEMELSQRIGEIFEEARRVYGYRRMQQELAKRGEYRSEYKVRKIMKENGYYPEGTKKYRPSRNGKTDGKYFENALNQDFKVEGPNCVWTGDITYIKTRIGFVYLAAIIDLFNREVVGYSISKSIDSELAKKALGNALVRTRGASAGLVFHSDRGCQYSSKSYQEMLRKHGIKGSMSRPACPYDNACTESFFSSAKRECIYRKKYDNLEEVRRDMFEYIELFYNRKRIHSSLGYLSPVEYRLSRMASQA